MWQCWTLLCLYSVATAAIIELRIVYLISLLQAKVCWFNSLMRAYTALWIHSVGTAIGCHQLRLIWVENTLLQVGLQFIWWLWRLWNHFNFYDFNIDDGHLRWVTFDSPAVFLRCMVCCAWFDVSFLRYWVCWKWCDAWGLRNNLQMWGLGSAAYDSVTFVLAFFLVDRIVLYDNLLPPIFLFRLLWRNRPSLGPSHAPDDCNSETLESSDSSCFSSQWKIHSIRLHLSSSVWRVMCKHEDSNFSDYEDSYDQCFFTAPCFLIFLFMLFIFSLHLCARILFCCCCPLHWLLFVSR